MARNVQENPGAAQLVDAGLLLDAPLDLAELVQEAVFHQHGEEGELAQHVAGHGQHHVVEEVEHLAHRGQEFVVVGHHA